MSGPAAGVGGGYGGLYHGHGSDPAATAGQLCFQLQQQTVPPCAAGAGDSTTAYASIADYLQGFLDHDEGLAAHFGSGDVDGQLSSSSGGCVAVAGADHQTPPRREGRMEREGEAAADAEADRNCKRRSDEKKMRGEKRGPRVAFVTKSEVDHLEDGYRWRKYGQKAVKNSTYPRSYYRCTAARCGVKKRVERSQQDPSTVITTYEGQHTHPSPVVGLHLGGGGGALMRASSACGSPLHRIASFVRPATAIDGYAAGGSGSGSFLPLLPRGMGGGGQPSSSLPSMRRRPFLLQVPQHHPSQLPAVGAYGGVLDFSLLPFRDR